MLRQLSLAFLLALPSFAQDPSGAPPKADATAADDTSEDSVDAAPATDETGPRVSTTADWGQWERLGRSALSPDGRWIAYSISRNDGTRELRLRVIATDSTEVFEQGTRPSFSNDGKWLAFSITKTEDEREKLSESGAPAESDLGLFDLVQGKKVEVEGVSTFSFSADGAFLAMRRHGEKGDEHGADLVVRDLTTGIDTHFGRVGAYSWSETDAWLAMTIDAPDQAGNGLRVIDASTGVMRTLDSAEADYGSLTWREDSVDLAVMRKLSYEDDEDDTFVVLGWRGLDRGDGDATAYDHLEDEGLSEDLHVVDFGGLRWSDDGEALFFGVKAWDTRPAKLDETDDEGEDDDSDAPEGDSAEESSATQEDDADEDDADEGDDSKGEDDEEADEAETKPDVPKTLRESLDEAPGVEVWHTKDIDIIPRQKRTAGADENESFLAALWLDDGKLVQLEDDDVESVTALEGQRMGLGRDETPYREDQRFSATLVDVYTVDLKTGDRERVLERVKYAFPGDPKGNRFLFIRDDQIWSYDIKKRSATNLTGDTETQFINQEDSSLTDEKRPYGVAGWTTKGDRVLLYDRYDIWSFPLDGGNPTRLTDGTEEAIRHRRVRVAADFDDEQFIDPSAGFYVSLYGDKTKKSGYGFLRPGKRLERLTWGDNNQFGLGRAKDAKVLAFVEERFDDSPDIFVSGPKLDEPKQVSTTNAFEDEFLWGHAELIDYQSTNGDALQGALYYPADYDPAKQYPMIVYIYELRSQGLHNYQTPSERSPYNTAVFTQNGYFVYQPDIVYRAQNPGLSAVECVVPAVRKVLESGKIDPARVGLVGHSWGAYQTAFIVTQTDIFAAGVAGAPLTNMMSMSMSIYWNSGQTDAFIFHESQGRMDRPFWRDVDTYIANSPIFSIENLNTPLLMTFGNKDGAVDWHQGVEMYNAARLAQRPLVMLVYGGENHGLRKKPNQVDYHHRVREWFDTHLKGNESPKWISDGLPWLDQKKALDKIGQKERSKGKSKGGKKGSDKKN